MAGKDFLYADIRVPCGLDAKTIQSRITPKLNSSEDHYGLARGKSKFRDIADIALQVEMETGVSATFMLALSAHETWYGCNSFSQDNNSMFSYEAYDDDPDQTRKHGGATLEEGWRKGAKIVIKDFVINKGHHTPYDLRWKGNYATDKEWANLVSSIWSMLQGGTPPKGAASKPTVSSSGDSDTSDPAKVTDPIVMGDGVSAEKRMEMTTYEMVGRNWQWATYTIKKGDTLAGVAKKYGQQIAFLTKWNGITTSTVLNPGWSLRVYPYYTIGSGDTIENINKDFGTTKDQLHKLNPYWSGMIPGQSLKLPNTVIKDTPPKNYSQINKEADRLSHPFETKLPNQAVLGAAPYVEDDEVPAHRYLRNPYTLRIGDVHLFIPPTSIRTRKEGFVDTNQTLRTMNGMMTRSGHTQRVIEIELFFPDTDQINGYSVKGPGGKTYYMDGLRPLIAQFMKNPFLPVKNELLNDRHHVYNVAFNDLTFETHELFDNVIVANLKLIECTVEPIVQYPDYYYDNLFMYPLFRWWYQQTLLNSDEQRKSARHLAPVPSGSMRNSIELRVLDREKVEDVVATTNRYKLSQMKYPSIISLMSEWAIGDAILRKVTVGINKQLQPIYLDHHEAPMFQDLGGMNREFILEFVCTSRIELESFNNLMSHLEEMSRDFRQKFVSGYLGIRNDVLNLAGIYNAMIMHMETETISEYDEEYVVRLYGRAFDATQKNNERVEGVNSAVSDINGMFSFSKDPGVLIEDKTHRATGTLYEAAIEEALATLELYPDLELPTYDDLNGAIKAINKFRRENGRKVLPMQEIKRPPRGIFADPDFYFAYNDIREVFNELNAGQFGQQIVNAINGSNDYRDYVMASNDLDYGWWLDGYDQDLTVGWDDDQFQKVERKKSNVNIDMTSNVAVDFTMDYGVNWSATNPIPQGDRMLEMMLHDMKSYNKRGRMVRAFPSYLILFVDEGQWLAGQRLWNNYYTYHAIQEISIVKDRSNPIDLAYIKMTNIYGSFDFSSRMSDPRTFMSKSTGIIKRIEKVFKNFTLSIDDAIVQERTQMIDQIKLKQGARIHLRMGYGASPAYMPTTFNGQVATINEGDQLELVCQSDGVEMTQIVSTEVDGKLTSGQSLRSEPQNIFRQFLVTRQSDFWFSASQTINLYDNYASAFGVEHFGYVESKAEEGFWNTLGDLGAYLTDKFLDTAFSKQEYDVMKNIFRGEQVNAFTDTSLIIDGELNISVNPFSRTMWDVCQAITLHTPEFICAVHPHGTRSTLFHGMPHWPVKYGYQRKRDIDGKPVGKVDDPTSYEELYKPFQQFHIAASGYDIVHNNIQVSSELLKHIGVGIYTKSRAADLTTTFPVYADRTIKQEIQKTMMVDTMVHQNLPGFEFMYDFARSTIGWVFDILSWGEDMASNFAIDLGIDKLREKMMNAGLSAEEQAEMEEQGRLAGKQARASVFGDGDAFDKNRIFQPGFEQALAGTIGSLQRNFQEMYQGELVMLGSASMKPWDSIFVSDEYTMMYGTIYVGQVTHTLSFQTGFMTVVKPDLPVTRVDGTQLNELWSVLQQIGGLGAGVLARRLLMTRAAKIIAKATGKGVVAGAKLSMKAAKGVSVLGFGKKVTRLAGDVLKQVDTVLGAATKLEGVAELGTKAMKLIRSNLITGIVLGWLIQKFEDWQRKEFGYNNVLFIYPLWKTGKPFVAGITGYKHIIPGYIDPEWWPIEEIEKIDVSDPSNVNKNHQLVAPRSSTANPITNPNNTQAVTPDKSQVTPKNAPNSKLKQSGRFASPCKDMRVTSKFGWRPKSSSMHNGIDIGPLVRLQFSTDVYALTDGKVIKVGVHDDMGNYLTYYCQINGTDYVITNMHMHSVVVKEGDILSPGQKVGVMGNTGRIFLSKPGDITPAMRKQGYGMHLHFEVEKGNKTRQRTNRIDPEPFLKSLGISTHRSK